MHFLFQVRAQTATQFPKKFGQLQKRRRGRILFLTPERVAAVSKGIQREDESLFDSPTLFSFSAPRRNVCARISGQGGKKTRAFYSPLSVVQMESSSSSSSRPETSIRDWCFLSGEEIGRGKMGHPPTKTGRKGQERARLFSFYLSVCCLYFLPIC